MNQITDDYYQMKNENEPIEKIERTIFSSWFKFRDEKLAKYEKRIKLMAFKSPLLQNRVSNL